MVEDVALSSFVDLFSTKVWHMPLRNEISSTGQVMWDFCGWLMATRVGKNVKNIKRKEIESVLVVTVQRMKPYLLIEEWRVAEREKKDVDSDDAALPVPVRTQMIEFTLSEEDGSVQVTGAPFTMRFHDIFFRDPANPQEGDLVCSKEELEKYGKDISQNQRFVEYDF